MAAVHNAPASKGSAKADAYQIITDRILEKMQGGQLPWQKPWHDLGAPRNYLTGREYTGVNSFVLHFLNEGKPLFLTFKQAEQLGGKIRKGAKGFPIIYYNVTEKEKEVAENEQGEKERRHFVRYSTVFSIDDVEGLHLILPEGMDSQHEPLEAAEALVMSWEDRPGMTHLDQRAYYVPAMDYVNMPAFGSFINAESYYKTLFHELVHSTGHVKRLNRPDLANNMAVKGAEGYAREELTAELGAAYLAGVIGINTEATEENSAAYLQYWMNVLKADNKLFFQAGSNAQKAVNLILGHDPYSPQAKVLTDRQLDEVAEATKPEAEATTALAA
jgi:antirestriction protein ArdC